MDYKPRQTKFSKYVNRTKRWYNKRGLSGLFNRSKQFAIGTIVINSFGGGYDNILLDRESFFELAELESVHMLEDDLSALTNLRYDDMVPDLNASTKLKEQTLRYDFDPPFVAEIQNAVAFSPHSTVITQEGKVTTDVVSNQLGRNRWMLDTAISNSPYDLISVLRTGVPPNNAHKIPNGIILYYHSNNFYHWMIEQLFKLRFIEYYNKITGEQPTLVVPDSAPTFVWEFLNLCGYERSDVYEWTNETLVFDRLVLPSLPEPTPDTLDWLDSKIVDNIPNTSLEAEWVYISRQEATRGRKVENYKDIVEILKKHDIKIVKPEEMSIEEEISLFSSVDGIIGPHGAGMTGIIWSSNIEVIEIFNQVITDPYFVISHLRGHNYQAISGKSTGNSKYEMYQNIYVDPDRLESVILRAMNNQTK